MASHPPTVNAFRHLPLSPPDTDHDSSHPPALLSQGGYPGVDQDMTLVNDRYQGAVLERANGRYQSRRPPTLAYQNSGARDPRDRGYARSPRNLVVVLPPPDLPLNQGHLGNVLSLGPRYRLSQGILMPLFPSMFAQLNAIAREYNFPSIAGLCLYLHVNDNGMTRTPRISDDSWQYLFGHLFEGRASPGSQQLPIGGSIEFDIDLNKARWFDPWAAGTLRDPDPAFQPMTTSHVAFGAHWRGESQTTNADEQPAEDQWDASGSHTLATNPRPETLRHVPKKLSLVDRLESHAVLALHKPQDRPGSPTHDLSPIPQSALPQPVTADLERRVNSWRATAELCPVSMTETYQPAADIGVSLCVTTMDEYALEPNSQKATNNEEYLWSLTTGAPQSPPMESPIASSRPISVHLDRRANGIVLLTPTTATSWGPADDERMSVASDESRLHSPSVGERVVEDIMAPRRCAVWGNSFGWRSETTWKEVYPYSAAQAKLALQVQLQDSNGFVPMYPNMVIYPTVESHSDMYSPHNLSKDIEPSPRPVWGSSFGWGKARTWRKVYPYSTVTIESTVPIQLCGAGELGSQYPNICIYPSVYPHLDIYPPAVEGVKTKGSGQLDASIYSLDGGLTSYPNLVIYPPVYPYFDLYPKVLQVPRPVKQEEVDVRLTNAGCLIAEYPNMTIYPDAYPHMEIYPTQNMKRAGSSVVWGISFGWLKAKTWLQVYPLHVANLLTSRRGDEQNRSSLGLWSESPATAAVVISKQSVWGSSFGWKNATTWRAVWPTPYAPNARISVCLGKQSESSLNYPYLIIYPAVYPHFNIYPPCATIVEVEEGQAKEDQCAVRLIPCYPNFVIYPAVYPHLDVYPPIVQGSVVVKRGQGQSTIRRRRIEMWRTRTAAQVGLADLLTHNHIWVADEPLQLDLADYAWSQTSAGPLTPPLELAGSPSDPGSIHIEHRIQGSVLLTPSTATTWGPPDDDWYSDTSSIERLPSPDLGQRSFDDIEASGLPRGPWQMVWPFYESASPGEDRLSAIEKSGFALEYPHLEIYPPAYPHFELYPVRVNKSTLGDQVVEMFPYSNIYPALDIYPAIYPHFNIYPTVSSAEIPSRLVSNVQHERVEIRLPVLYPNFDIYQACYPYNLDYIYPSADAMGPAKTPIETLPDYPGIELRPVGVKLPAQYPILDIYPAGYPWSLESLYPAVSTNDFPEVIKPYYPCIRIYSPVYPFVEPYPGASSSIHIPGGLDEGEYASAKAFLAWSESTRIDPGYTIYPHCDLYPASPLPREGKVVQDAYGGELSAPTPRMPVVVRRNRKTHVELHASVLRSLRKRSARISKTHAQLHVEVFQEGEVSTPSGCIKAVQKAIGDLESHITPTERTRRTHMELRESVFRSLGKRPARNSKTHAQLHGELFQDGIVWTPSGYVQDIPSLIKEKLDDVPVRQSRRRPSKDTAIPQPSPSRLVINIPQSPGKVVFPLSQPPPLPPLSPLHVRSPIPSQPSLAVSEAPSPRVSSPTINPYTHKRTASSRLTQAVKSLVPGLQRRGASTSTTPESPPPGQDKERVKGQLSPTRILSLIDRRSPTVSLPHTNASSSELLTRAPPSSQRKDTLVLQRAKAYEEVTAASQSSGIVGIKRTHSPFTLPSLTSIPPMTDVAETIEKSKATSP